MRRWMTSLTPQMLQLEKKSKLIALAMLIGIVFFFIGFYVGSYSTAKVVAKLASGFIDVDEQLVYDAIFKYKNNIGLCFPPLNNSNAYIYDNERD